MDKLFDQIDWNDHEPKSEAAIPPTIPGAEEKATVDVRCSANDGRTISYCRLYARSGKTVGTAP